VYDELRRVAGKLMQANERTGHTLQPTALVAEAYLRMVAAGEMNLVNRGHFFAVAARAMRHVLVDHAREKFALKRGGKRVKVDVDPDAIVAMPFNFEQVMAVDEALTRLEKLDRRQAQMVEMQYFAGNTVDEIAAALGMHVRTAKRQLQTGRLFLAQQLDGVGLKLG